MANDELMMKNCYIVKQTLQMRFSKASLDLFIALWLVPDSSMNFSMG